MITIKAGRYNANCTREWWDTVSDTARKRAVAEALELPEDVELAKALCADCPMRVECLAGALERHEPWGVWGGEIFEKGSWPSISMSSGASTPAASACWPLGLRMIQCLSLVASVCSWSCWFSSRKEAVARSTVGI